MTETQYEVLAVRYAHVERRSPQNFIGGDSHDVPMPMDYAVWVIRGDLGTVVVDTGFDQLEAELRGRTLVTPVDEALHAVGVDHEAVTDVIITHLHYDHAGNTDLFPNARFHLQEREMRYATGPAMTHRACAAAFSPDNVATMVRRVFDRRVRFHDGYAHPFPGIELHHVGGHTMGLQVVRVQTARGPILLASDACHYYANYSQRRAFPEVYNVAELMSAYDRFLELVDDDDHVVPGHDPRVFADYPQPSPGAARLDLPPERPATQPVRTGCNDDNSR
ncbi:N-acyl homoserine lactonase family protein [Pseudonocardia kujensis]|uniref:N-acyl homoserine lactonase family protein n=1 Tax=Pseudonocardia kujensis TaxID=1128675 RepID=UPI001E3746B8|nr:N-acyl homoserine lactonase family protein [Pseudonocardia kujensis]MCE0762095.1 N-acyl homoserine lactonase family protein [Pseudonocardia kujensis]